MPKIQMKNEQYFITLPRKLVLAKGWKKGDKVEFVINAKGNLELESI